MFIAQVLVGPSIKRYKKMLYKIQRGEWTASVSAKIVQRNLIVLSHGRIWLSYGEKIPWIKTLR